MPVKRYIQKLPTKNNLTHCSIEKSGQTFATYIFIDRTMGQFGL